MDDAVSEAMRAVPRARFLPRLKRRAAHVDQALAIGYGQTCSQPSTVSRMLRLLAVEPGHRVLDVGSGTGWTTALLRSLVGPDGWVLGVEIVPELVERGRANLAAAGVIGVRIEPAKPGHLGRPEDAPFDRILVSANSEVLPGELVDQLGPGGILVIPVDGRMLRVVVGADGSTTVTTHGFFRFVPLVRRRG